MDRKLPFLPDDIIEEIVLRLPSKSAARFRCISTLWRTRLSSSTFTRAHFDFHVHSTAPVSIFFMNQDYDYPEYPSDGNLVSFPANGGQAKLVTSPLFKGQVVIASAAFGGLVLVESLMEDLMFLFNPITGEALRLPQSSSDHECRIHLGFGYDSSSQDYKIVQIYYGRDYERVNVYSFKTKSWRKLNNSPYQHGGLDLPDPSPGVLVNGCLHWLAFDINVGGSSCIIAAFDLGRENFQEVPPPAFDDSYGEEASDDDDGHGEEGSDDDDGYGEEGSEDSYEGEGFGVSSRVFGEDDSGGISDDDSFSEESSDYSSGEEGYNDSSGEEGLNDECHLLVLGGCLAVVLPLSDDEATSFDVWVMREYGVQESWEKIVIRTKGRNIDKFVYLSREDELVFSLYDDTDVYPPYSLSFAAYSLSTRVWRDISVHGSEYAYVGKEDGVVAFTECLLSPNHL